MMERHGHRAGVTGRMTGHRGFGPALFGLLLGSTMPCTALGQDAPDARSIVETVLEKRAERLAGVEDYTVVQTLNGSEATLYYERVEVDGVTVFRIVPPGEYQREALEKAGLGGGMTAMAGAGAAPAAASGVPVPGAGPPGAGPGPGGAAGPGGALPPLLEGLPLPEGLSLPGGLELPGGGLPFQGGVPVGVPGIPGPGGNGAGLLQQAAGAGLGAAAGGFQQQLAQKGMQGLMNRATSGDDDGVAEALVSVRGLEDLGKTGRLEGTEVVDGATCYVLRTDRIQDPELARWMGAGADFTLRSLTVWIDAQEYVSRRSRVTGEVTIEGRPQELTIEILEQDYRPVEGMLEPFRRVIRMPGAGALFAAEDPAKAERIQKDMQENLAKIKEMEEMLAQMPPEQRRMVEAQMGPALAQMQAMAEGGIEDTETVIEVKEVRVNAGPPTPFGTGSLAADQDVGLEMAVVARVSPVPDETGRAAGWVIDLIGALEGQAGGVVQVAALGELSGAGDMTGNAVASFRWQDGRQGQFAAPEGGAVITITSNDGRRVAGEFGFEATGRIQRAGDAREARTVVRGRFEAPIPPVAPNLPGMGGS